MRYPSTLKRSQKPVNILPPYTRTFRPATAPFWTLLEEAAAAVLFVNQEGYFTYANPAAEALLGYSVAELKLKHVVDVVEADTPWVVSTFEVLLENQTWSGRVLLRRRPGDLLKISVNAFSNTVPDGRPEFTAFLRATSVQGPAIEPLAATELQAGFTVRQLSLLHLIAEGFDDSEIATILGDETGVINREVAALLSQLQVASRTAACVAALREGLIS